jgi:predicted DNA-binding transcriptional regulator AlpA
MEIGDRTTPIEMWPGGKVDRVIGSRKSKRYDRVRAGTFPPPVKCGSSSRWPSNEIEALRDFQIAHNNASKGELQSFVLQLVAKRSAVEAAA